MATVAIFAVAQGLTYPLLSFILERQAGDGRPHHPNDRQHHRPLLRPL
jgi:hypothetical protein